MITIIDYNAGNITSVKRAFDHLGIKSRISGSYNEIVNSERLVFPGVGNALSAMKYLNDTGIGAAIIEAALKGTPLLGICLGTQIILSYSEEGQVDCLNLIEGRVRKIVSDSKDYKIPHMGWDDISLIKEHYLFKEVKPEDKFYFVHSYYVDPADKEVIIGTCNYAKEIPVILGRKNIVSVQFHPEKSGKPGLSILKQFNSWEV